MYGYKIYNLWLKEQFERERTARRIAEGRLGPPGYEQHRLAQQGLLEYSRHELIQGLERAGIPQGLTAAFIQQRLERAGGHENPMENFEALRIIQRREEPQRLIRRGIVQQRREQVFESKK